MIMDIAVGIQNAINYIENHLTENIDYNQLAKEACVSNFYFQRIFCALCGYTIGDYIRFRRLTLAGNELLNSNEKIINVALKYGYETPESFTRAFTKFHGITPSQARIDGSKLKSFLRLSVNITLRGGSMQNYKIVKKDAFTVLEKVEKQSSDNEINKASIPDFWTRSWQDGTVKTIIDNLSGSNDIYGICYNNPNEEDNTFDYSIAGMCESNITVPYGYRINTIPARTWVVVECIGEMPEAMQNAWHKICSEFIPSSNFEPTYEFDIEAYSEGDMNSPNYKSEIWIPIKEK
jgi:AraC family transcriptional regulator